MTYSRLVVGRLGGAIRSYVEVLKPRETSLLTFTGFSAAIVGANGQPSLGWLLLTTVAILLGSGGTNGLTNYIDRHVDARMERTRHRPLPSGRIAPAQKMLPLAIALVLGGLVIAWFLDPLCFVFGALGVVASTTWRKKVTCVFPQGTIASCSPILIGYIAMSHRLDLTLLFLCILIGLLVPVHVWSVMIANRDDYMAAGITYFPLSWQDRDVIRLLLGLAVLLFASSIGLYFFSDLGIAYLVAAVVLGVLLVVATARLLATGVSHDAWRLYKLTAFPYLGVLFLIMVLDLWLL
ncbi:MAG: UbiA family prenyltransferase [Chloroflexota bacterium]|nr:UbiA family prenyltransferase [Chloroflexota bacterium]